MAKQAAECPDDAAGCAHAAGRPAAATLLVPLLRGPSSRDVRLHALDIGKREAADRTCADERLDMGFDAARIHLERRRLNGPPLAAEDLSGPGVLQVPVA